MSEDKIIWQAWITAEAVKGLTLAQQGELTKALDKSVEAICTDFGLYND